MGVALFALGCNAKIGDGCSYDVDCSPDGDRICDNSQPGGYCLILTCSPDQCPEEAVCVEFVTPSPEWDAGGDTDNAGALYEQLEPNRIRTYCLRRCKTDGGCRGAYHCARGGELEVELGGLIIDSRYAERGVCVPDADAPVDGDSATETAD